MSIQESVDFREIHANHRDLNGARDWMSSICGPHWLTATAPQRIQFHHAANRLRTLGTVVGSIEYGTDVTVGVEDASSLTSYSISLPLAGEQELIKDHQRFVSNSDFGLIVSPDENQELVIGGNCRKVLIAISRQSMRSCLEALLQMRTEQPLRFEPLMDARNGAVASWWRTARYLQEEMSRCQALYGHVAFARDMESALIKGLILSQPNNYSAALQSARETKIPHYLLRAKAIIEERSAEDLHLEDIEVAAGVSRVKLFEGFKRYFDITPMAYLKRYRLEAVRRAILCEPCSRQISVIAMNWGFTHLGRFSSEYKKLFGESPSATAQRHKPV
jgi:AraC-like DNA-binding protein